MRQYFTPFISRNSDTAQHLDHIDTLFARDKAGYAFNTSPDSL